MNSAFVAVIGVALIGVFFAPGFYSRKGEVNGIREMEATNNKKLTMNMIQELIGDKNVDSMDKYVSPDVINHNPNVAHGTVALKAFFREWFKDSKQETIDFKRIMAEGDFVWVYFQMKFMGADVAVMELFRIENGKIAEQWDVMQPIAAKSANDA